MAESILVTENHENTTGIFWHSLREALPELEKHNLLFYRLATRLLDKDEVFLHTPEDKFFQGYLESLPGFGDGPPESRTALFFTPVVE